MKASIMETLQSKEQDPIAIIGFVLGIVSCVFCCGCFGMFFGIGGMVCSTIALVKLRQSEKKPEFPFALVGVIAGAAGFLFSLGVQLIWWIWYGAAMFGSVSRY